MFFPSRALAMLHYCLLMLLLAAAPVASAACEGDWLVDPDATGAESQAFLTNFYVLLADLTHTPDDETDQHAVHRLMIDGELHVTAPWFTSSTVCTDDGGALHKNIANGPNIIADPTLEHYLMVTDELSELAWVVSLGTDEYEPLMIGIDRTVRAMGSDLYPGLPCWIAEVDENDLPPRITCVSEDTATDGTVRLGLAYYNAANNPHFSAGSRAWFRQRGDAIAAEHLAIEYLHETHTSGVTGRNMDHWAGGGGNTVQTLAGMEMFIGYYPDIALFLLAAHVSTGESEYLDRAEDVVDQFVSANSFDGSSLSLGSMKFRWVDDGSGALEPAEIAAWDVSDAPRALWMGHVLHAHQLTTDGAAFLPPYASLSEWVQALLATDTQTETSSCIEYNPDGTAVQSNCGGNYYYHGLSMGLLTFHNVTWLPTKLLNTISHPSYAWGDPRKYWDFTDCFGIYRPVRALKALAAAIGLDSATYGGRRPKACFLDVVRTGSGSGFVVSHPTGIDCGTDCRGLFLEAEAMETIQLAAAAYQGSSFGGWTEAACTNGDVFLSGDTTCTASFNGTCNPVVDLQSQSIAGTETFAGCGELRAGNGFTVLAGADLTLRAGDRIVLYDGFSVEAGASLSARAGAEP